MKSTFKTIQLGIAAFLLIAVAFTSCKSKTANTDAQLTDEKIKQEVEQYAYPISSVFEVTKMLNDIDASFIGGITNDPSKAESYLQEKSRALNLGVYTADLAYATTYNQKAEVQSYFKAAEALLSGLSMKQAFSTDLPSQIEANIDNKEKLVELVTSMFQNGYSFLNEQSRTELSYLILAGTVVEGLYLTCNLAELTTNNTKLVEAIMHQKEPLKKIETLMETYKDSENTASVLADIKVINSLLNVEVGSTISQKQLEELSAAVAKARQAYIQ